MKSWLILLLTSIVFSLSAQNDTYYTIQVGTFVDAKRSDFNNIQSLGFLHALKLQGNLSQIYLGGYKDKKVASQIASEVRANGFSNAFVEERYLTTGKPLVAIQLATRSVQQKINWESFAKAGELFILVERNNLKILTGTYASVEDAKRYIDRIRKLGFQDAFVKKVNDLVLHKVGSFETGIKQPLIPLAFEESAPRNDRPRSYDTNRPSSYDTNRPNRVESIPESFDQTSRKGVPSPYVSQYSRQFTGRKNKSVAQPNIRAKIKRSSALQLQQVLKAEGTYRGSIDGYYGSQTAAGYNNFVNGSRTFRKYLILADNLEAINTSQGTDATQEAINNLLDDPTAVNTLERSKTPISKAYQAYLIFATYGPRSDVNNLMNLAIKEAFAGRSLNNQPPFDFRATYAYNDLYQLLLHLHYIHAAPGQNYALPCWINKEHPEESALVFANLSRSPYGDLEIQSCEELLNWEEIRVLQAMCLDLNPDETLDGKEMARAASYRSQLLINPPTLRPEDLRILEDWNNAMWGTLDNWGRKDPLHNKLVTPLHVAYLQSQVRLEDYFMDKGFQSTQAKGLALATLRTLVEYHLARLI